MPRRSVIPLALIIAVLLSFIWICAHKKQACCARACNIVNGSAGSVKGEMHDLGPKGSHRSLQISAGSSLRCDHLVARTGSGFQGARYDFGRFLDSVRSHLTRKRPQRARKSVSETRFSPLIRILSREDDLQLDQCPPCICRLRYNPSPRNAEAIRKPSIH